MAKLDNILGSQGALYFKGVDDNIMNDSRTAFVNRPLKGKTRRKKLYPPHGTKTNVGDPRFQRSKGKHSS